MPKGSGTSTPSRVVARLEFREPTRTPRAHTPGSQRTLHSGLIYPDGTIHSKGRLHTQGPASNDVLNTTPRAATPTPIYSVGGTLSRHVTLPSSKPNASPRPVRTSSPSVAVTGRKHIVPSDSGDVVAHTGSAPTTPRREHGKMHTATPRDSYIVGLNVTADNAARESPSRPRARRFLDGPPQFVPSPYTPKPYTPQLRRDYRPEDHGVFNTGESALRQSTPVRTGRQRPPPQPSSNPITWQ